MRLTSRVRRSDKFINHVDMVEAVHHYDRGLIQPLMQRSITFNERYIAQDWNLIRI